MLIEPAGHGCLGGAIDLKEGADFSAMTPLSNLTAVSPLAQD